MTDATPPRPAWSDKPLKSLCEKLTCVETRAAHPACDYCGEILGVYDLTTITEALAELSRRQQEIDTLKAELAEYKRDDREQSDWQARWAEVIIQRGTLEQEIARLQQAQTWQPMATAPEDGDVIVRVQFDEDFSDTRLVHLDRFETHPLRARMTHWMPLPVPPKED